jgi:hypothetical protein
MIKKKIVGVITYWWSKENYGQILQMYSLQKYLETLGCSPFLIKYDPRSDHSNIRKISLIDRMISKMSLKKIILYLKNLYTNKVILNERVKYPRKFDDFRQKYIHETDIIYYSLQDLKQHPPEADVYITGSDVVWGTFRSAYYLDFGSPEAKRIAYAPSFGRTSISENERQLIKPLLEKFDLVTVRESQGVDVCASAGIQNAILVLDPTLLLPREHYLRIAEIPPKTNKFCYLYLLGNEIEVSVRSVINAIKGRNMEVVYTTSDRVDIHKKVYPTVNEWLGYYTCANIIITNSFHGCIFSIIFNKNFIFLPLKGRHAKLNVRIQSLLMQLNLKERIFDNNIEKLFDKEIMYEDVNELLQTKINEIDNLMREELDCNK